MNIRHEEGVFRPKIREHALRLIAGVSRFMADEMRKKDVQVHSVVVIYAGTDEEGLRVEIAGHLPDDPARALEVLEHATSVYKKVVNE